MTGRGKSATSSTTTPSSSTSTTAGTTSSTSPATSGQSGPRGRTSSASAGAGEISANTTTIKSKLGPAAPDNILHNYANYTYKISLMCWNTYEDYNKVVEHGTWEKMPGLVANNNKVLFASGGVPAERRHPAFNVDFYIVDMSTTSMMGMSSDTRSTNLFELSMSVVEPLGTTLLERLEAVLTTDGPNWTEKPLLIQVEFLGYDEAGTPTLIKPATRYIPVRLINMTFDVQGSGSTYQLEFVATCMMKKNPLTNALHCKTLTGSNIQEFADQIVEAFDKEQKARSTDVTTSKTVTVQAGDFQAGERPGLSPGTEHTRKVITAKVQEVADQIEFTIHPDIANATISPNVASETNLKVKVQAKTAHPDHTEPKMVYKNNAGIRYESLEKGGYTVSVCDKGQSYLSFFEQLIRESTFITDQLNDPTKIIETHAKKAIKKEQLLKDKNAPLRWFKVTWAKTLLAYDSMRNEYASKMVVQVDPYVTVDPVATTATVLPGEGDVPPVARNYQYQYTGQNVDILDLAIGFNNAFFQTVMGMGTGNDGSSKESVTANDAIAQGGGDNQDYAVHGPATSRSGESGQFNAGTHTTNVQKTASTLMENLYKKVGSDMMQISLSIVGDPAYIQQDGILHMTTANKSCFKQPLAAVDPLSGAVLCDQSDCHIYVVYRTPEDINEATGITDFSVGDKRFKSSTLSGYYRVWEVQNTFSGGTFTQSIEATRIYDQARDASSDNSLVDKNSRLGPGEGKTADNRLIQLAKSSKPATTSGGDPTVDPTARTSLPDQVKKLKSDMKTEGAGISADSVANNDTTVSNSLGNSNALAKQQGAREAVAFRAAEAKRAGITSISTTSVDATTLASQSAGNNFEVSASSDGSLTPVYTEKTGVAASRADRLATKRSAWRAAQGTSKKTTSNVINSSMVVTDSAGSVLLSNNKGNGLVGSEIRHNISSYESADQTSIRTNDRLIQQARQSLISALNPADRIVAYQTGNVLSKTNQTTHSKYGNRTDTWDDIGYYSDVGKE